jgi:hypothetical protein
LREMGYGADHIEITAVRMDEITLGRAIADNKQKMKLVKKSARTELSDADIAKLPKANPNKVYYGGWIVSFPTTKKMMQVRPQSCPQ